MTRRRTSRSRANARPGRHGRVLLLSSPRALRLSLHGSHVRYCTSGSESLSPCSVLALYAALVGSLHARVPIGGRLMPVRSRLGADSRGGLLALDVLSHAVQGDIRFPALLPRCPPRARRRVRSRGGRCHAPAPDFSPLPSQGPSTLACSASKVLAQVTSLPQLHSA
jgi:hypothetical protein